MRIVALIFLLSLTKEYSAQKMKPSYLRPLIVSTISLGIIAAFTYYLYINADKYLKLLQISTNGVIALFALSLTYPFLGGIINTTLFRALGAKISYWDGFNLTAASTLANQLPVSGGIVSRGYYLNRFHGVSYMKFFSATFALFFCFVSVNGMVGVGVLLYWSVSKATPIPSLLLLSFVVMSSFFLFFWLPLEKIKIPGRISDLVRQALDGWEIVRKNLPLLLQLIGLQTCLMVLLAFRYWFSFHMLSQNIALSQAILFAAASILTQIVSIAPGGLGVREAIVGIVASTLGFDGGTSIVAVGLDRLVSTLVIIVIGGISTVVLGGQISVSDVKTDL